MRAGRRRRLGYLRKFPDYWTQGESLDDLTAHLDDLYNDLATGRVPGREPIRKPRVLGLGENGPRSWMAPHFDDPLPDEFWGCGPEANG